MKSIINQTNGVIININDREQEIYLSHVRKSVVFTVTLPLTCSEGALEKWLCAHMSENDCTQGYSKVVKELNNALHLYMPEKERRFPKTYETKYIIDGFVRHTAQCGEHYDSTDMGEKLASGQYSSIAIASDEYRIVIDSDLEAEIYEATTGQLPFQFPLDTTDFDQLAVLGQFKEDCLDYLRKFASLHLGKVSDPIKRALVISATTKYKFNQHTLKRLVETCAKYDNLGLVETNHSNHAIGFIPNTLWTYCGEHCITMWAYDNLGSEMERISFDE